MTIGERLGQTDVSWRQQLKRLNGQDSGRLFQREGAQEWNALAPELVLILGTNRLIPLFDLSEWDGSDAASMDWR